MIPLIHNKYSSKKRTATNILRTSSDPTVLCWLRLPIKLPCLFGGEDPYKTPSPFILLLYPPQHFDLDWKNNVISLKKDSFLLSQYTKCHTGLMDFICFRPHLTSSAVRLRVLSSIPCLGACLSVSVLQVGVGLCR